MIAFNLIKPASSLQVKTNLARAYLHCERKSKNMNRTQSVVLLETTCVHWFTLDDHDLSTIPDI